VYARRECGAFSEKSQQTGGNSRQRGNIDKLSFRKHSADAANRFKAGGRLRFDIGGSPQMNHKRFTQFTNLSQRP
jgi:hypothetical protein